MYSFVYTRLNTMGSEEGMVRNYAKYAVLGVICLTALGSAAGALACSTEAWLGGASGIPANAMAGSPPSVSRYSELCGFAVTATSHVQDNNPSDARYRARFYVLDGLTGSDPVDIFEAYSDEAATAALFRVRFDGAQFTFDATSAGGGSASIGSANGWNSVEFDWDTGSNTFSFWVNTDATTDEPDGSVNAGAGTVESVRLGAPNGFAPQTGKLTYDAFESRRTTPVGRLLVGDSNGNGSITIADVVSVLNELAGTLQIGQPDCNENGTVTIADAVCLINSL